MANDSIYLMSGDELVEMRSKPYESEDLLQVLLAKHPDLLAGSQMDRDIPRRWLPVRRELGVSGKEGEASRFSLDHLFIDQDGIPTLVEVKRSTDTRLRREVVRPLAWGSSSCSPGGILWRSRYRRLGSGVMTPAWKHSSRGSAECRSAASLPKSIRTCSARLGG